MSNTGDTSPSYTNITPIRYDRFVEISNLHWIVCRQWATGGSVGGSDDPHGIANSGVLNDPISDLWGNTKYLKVTLEDLTAEYEAHLTDINAHSTEIGTRIESFMSSWLIPASKIKTSLTHETGITDDNIQTGAEILENKLHLELRGEDRPPLTDGAASTYANTGDLANDLFSLYRMVSVRSNSFVLAQKLGEFVSISGWATPIPLMIDQNAPGAFRIVGNRIAYVNDKESVLGASCFVKGVPISIGLDPITSTKPFIGNFLMECGLEQDNSLFSDLSSSNMFDSNTVTRQDIVFLELWAEDVPPTIGYAVPFGNTFYVDRNNGYSGIRYRQTSKGVTVSDNGFEPFASDPANLVFTDAQSRLVQLKSRIRLEMDKDDLSKCSPQGHLSVPVGSVLDETQAGINAFIPIAFVNSVESGSKLHLTSDSVELYTGNIICFTGDTITGITPYTAGSSAYYYVIRPNIEGNKSYIQIATTYADCFSGNFVNISAPQGPVSTKVNLCVDTHAKVEFSDPEDVLGAFNTHISTSVSGTWESGTPVFVGIPQDENVAAHVPEFFDDATYYVDQVRPGWVALYRHDTPHDSSTALKQISFTVEGADPIAGMIVITSNNFGFSQEVKLCDYTLDNACGYLRSNKEWGSMHPVTVTKKETPSYVFTEKGEVTSDKTYYVAAVLDPSTGSYAGVVICNTYDDAINGIGAKLVDYRLASGAVLSINRHHVFAQSDQDPSCWKGLVTSAGSTERSEVLALPLFSINRRNAGIFHPIYNPNGTAMAVRGASIASVSDCFRDDYIVTYNLTTKEFSTWDITISNSSEAGLSTSSEGIVSGKIVSTKNWAVGTEVIFTLDTHVTGDALPGGIVAGTSYWVLVSTSSNGKYNVQIATSKESITPVALTAAPSGTMSMKDTSVNTKTQFTDQSMVVRTGYSVYKEKGNTSAGLFYGVSGRPDGLYYDVASPGDITDLRNQLVMDSAGMKEIMSRNLDILFRGANVVTSFSQNMSDNTSSGIKAPVVLQTDTLDYPDSGSTPTIGSIVNHRKTKQYARNVLFSNDLLDGLRRTWSDAAVIQNEADFVMFGESLNELPTQFLDTADTYGLGQTRVANFSHSMRLGDTVSPKQLLDIDYYVLKYRSLENGGTNKLALAGVKIARGGEASGDFEGAKTDDSLRTTTFEPTTIDSPYRVLDIHTETVGGVSQTLETDLGINKVTVLNNGRSVDIDVVPFRLPKPLSYGNTYYLFEDPDGNGYYRLSTSLRPSSSKESISFVVDGNFMPGKLYNSRVENTSTTTYDHGIAIKPVFSTRRDFVRRNVTLNIAESYIALREGVKTGTSIRFLFPDDYSGNNSFTYTLPSVLSGNILFYAIESGRIQIGENYFYKIRLAATEQDASMENYISFGTDSGDTGDLFFLDIGKSPFINVVFDYPNTIRPLSMAGNKDDCFQDLSAIETGCPITISPNGTDILPSPFAQNTVYYAHKVSNQEMHLCATPKEAASGTPIELKEEGGRYAFTINPGVYYTRNVMLPPSPVLLTGSDGVWHSGSTFRMIAPQTSGLMYIKNDGTESEIADPDTLLFYVINVDSKRFRIVLADGVLEGVTKATIGDLVNRNFDLLDLSAPETGILPIVPTSIGIRGNIVVDAGIPYLKLKDLSFDLPVGTKIRFTDTSATGMLLSDAYSSSMLPVLNASQHYYLAPKLGSFDENKTQEFQVALTYTDAYNCSIGRGNPVLINLSSISDTLNVQVVGFPAQIQQRVLENGTSVGKILVGGASGTPKRITIGTPVFIDYYSDSPTYIGRNFPNGLERNRLYYTSDLDITDVNYGMIFLYDSLRDVEEENPITFEYNSTNPMYFQIVPAAMVENVGFSSDHRLTEVQIPDGWPYTSIVDITGIPLKILSTVLDEQFPVVSGLRPNTTYYAVRTSEDRIGFCKTFQEAVDFGNSDLISFASSPDSIASIDTSASMEIVPQPVDSLGNPLGSYTFNADSVDIIDNSVRVAAKFLTGTPVYFNPYSAGSLGTGIQINSTYYVVVRRILDENTPSLDISLVDNLEAAYIYDSKNIISSVGSGYMKIVPLNRAEISYTSGKGIVVLNDFSNSWLRNSIQTTQNWITGTPVNIQNVGTGLLPQYYEYGDRPSLIEDGSIIDIPTNDVDVNLDTVSDSAKTSYSEWSTHLSGGEALLVEEVGNDIPVGLNKDQIYYVCGMSKRGTVPYFKLASSYQDAINSIGSNIRYVSPSGLLSISSWKPPVLEQISMGSGYLDLSSNTIKVNNTWPSGVPIKLVPSSGSTLPAGLSTSDSYFTYYYGPNQIQLIEDLKDYYRFRFGGYSFYGNTGEGLPIGSPARAVPEDVPRIISLSDSDTVDPNDPAFVPVIDSPLEGGSILRIWVERAGTTSPGQFTQIDKIRFGSVEITPDTGNDFFPYEEQNTKRYIQVTIPPYSQDSIVEICVRKKTVSGDYFWSPPVLFVY